MRYLPGTATNGDLGARQRARRSRQRAPPVCRFDGVPLSTETVPLPKDYQGTCSSVRRPGRDLAGSISSAASLTRYARATTRNRDQPSGRCSTWRRVAKRDADHRAVWASPAARRARRNVGLARRDWRDRPLEWLLSLRQSTAELALKAAGRSQRRPDFLDGLGRVAVRVGERSQLSAQCPEARRHAGRVGGRLAREDPVALPRWHRLDRLRS